ncbi:hypothetical protein GE061_019124 [Apolygus lucorum]|uniref:C2H2-type domain-containing protein n=1 Tax=Apolygus lucorum TaxID=248454 RepID=A0A6A4JTF6_APOLU|nr:hypothetical protein GE061_019124 [Apolygus lucorum]
MNKGRVVFQEIFALSWTRTPDPFGAERSAATGRIRSHEFFSQVVESRLIMTMDVRRRCVESSSPFINTRASPGTDSRDSEGSSSSPSPITVTPPKPAVKRSFDVAFLMAPDDNVKKRHQEQLKLVSTGLLQRYSPPLQETKSMSYSEAPLGLLMPSKQESVEEFSKSAFTKVGVPGRVEHLSSSPVMSPAVSPDLSYQGSLSPPSRNRSPQQYYTKNPQYLPGKASATPPYLYQSTAMHREKGPRSSPETGFPGQFLKSHPEDKGSSSKRVYPGEVMPYGALPMAAAYPFPGTFAGSGAQVPALLTAAANVTAALLPSSLAAFTLPAQNVCAKCNISFRMTSDLVYHMRSQHKSDSFLHDSSRRRREQDKLRCPVCNETFRERHHLTRHMTAHQDKDGDKVDEEEDVSMRRRIHK